MENQFIEALRVAFNLEVKRATRLMDVYVMTVQRTNAPRLRQDGERGPGGGVRGGFRVKGASMIAVVDRLEDALARPVLDETKLEGFFTVDMKWEMSAADLLASLPQNLRQGESLNNIELLMAELAKPEGQQLLPNPVAVIAAARNCLGLELTPTKRAIEGLEVRKAISYQLVGPKGRA